VGQDGSSSLADDDRRMLREALRAPHGIYGVQRAAQLSGVPQRTVYHWASTGVLVPDYYRDRPKGWSYRDLVYLRLIVWLRSHGVRLVDVSRKVSSWRAYFEQASDDVETVIRADGVGVARGTFDVDELTGQLVFEPLVEHTARFDLFRRRGHTRPPAADAEC
jgi:DNA-binding transcriptional MerR regulator